MGKPDIQQEKYNSLQAQSVLRRDKHRTWHMHGAEECVNPESGAEVKASLDKAQLTETLSMSGLV